MLCAPLCHASFKRRITRSANSVPSGSVRNALHISGTLAKSCISRVVRISIVKKLSMVSPFFRRANAPFCQRLEPHRRVFPSDGYILPSMHDSTALISHPSVPRTSLRFRRRTCRIHQIQGYNTLIESVELELIVLSLYTVRKNGIPYRYSSYPA